MLKKIIAIFPSWIWASLGAAVLMIGAAYWFTRPDPADIPNEFTTRRSEVERIFSELESVSETDLHSLPDLEANKNFREAVTLLDRAISENRQEEALIASLRPLASDLTERTAAIQPRTLASEARRAFEALGALAVAELRYYELRRGIYEIARDYYQARASGQPKELPNELGSMAKDLEGLAEEIRSLKDSFQGALAAFDQAEGKRK